MLTKNDIAAIRKADDLCIHLNKANPQGLIRLIKRKPMFDAKPFEQDQEHLLTASATIETIRGRQALESGAAECFECVGIYHSQHTPVSSILKTLKEGDEITFVFSPDYHCNGYVAAAGLHADALLLNVTRNGKRQTWELATQVCENNSARMCRGVPNSDDYNRSAEERRKVA